MKSETIDMKTIHFQNLRLSAMVISEETKQHRKFGPMKTQLQLKFMKASQMLQIDIFSGPTLFQDD